MSATADCIVIGGGIVGLSTAFQIARRGGERIVLLEKAGAVAEGSTGASSAILRQRYTHPEVIRLARDGLRAYTHWAAFTGLRAPRTTATCPGVLWMTGEPREVMEQDRDRMAKLGIAAELLEAADLRERYPALSDCGIELGTDPDEHRCQPGGPYLLERDGGYTDPVSAAQDLLEAARREGVDVRLRTPVRTVRAEAGRVRGIELGDGVKIDAPIVINAAGPWCHALTRSAGVELPWTLHATRVQVLFRERPSEVEGTLPVAADGPNGIYFRPESRGQQILIGSIRSEDEQERVDDPDRFDRSVDPDFREAKLLGLHHRIPALPHRGRVSGLAGLYTVCAEDVHPIVGPTPLEGYVVANGFSGHGFKLAPMVGSILARWLTGKEAPFDTDVPLAFLAPDRAPLSVRTHSVLA